MPVPVVREIAFGPTSPIIILDDNGDSCMDPVNNAVRMSVVSGGSIYAVDGSDFAEGVDSISISGGVFNDSPTQLTAGKRGSLRLSQWHDLRIVPCTTNNTELFTAATPGQVSQATSVTEQVTLTDRSGTITTGGTAQQLAAAKSTRRYLFVQNNSSGVLWINFGTTAVQSQPSIKLPVDAIFIMPSGGVIVSTESVSIIGATTGQAFTAKEV